MQNLTDRINTYLKALQAHDWSYDFSDDHETWKRGFNSKQALLNEAKEIDKDFLIWDSIAPNDIFKGGK